MTLQNQKPIIKAIIFDLGGVVLFFDHMIAAKKMSKKIGVSVKKIIETIADSGDSSYFIKSAEKGAPSKEYWKIAAKEWNIKKINTSLFDSYWNSIFWKNTPIFGVIKKLRKKYKVALLSNLALSHKIYVNKKWNVNKLFHKTTYSCDINSRKPRSKIYKLTLKKLGVKPSEAIFIDNMPRNDYAADKLGIHGLTFTTNKQMIKDLKKLGVEI